MKDGYDADIEIGTVFDRVCNPEIRIKFLEIFKNAILSEGLNPTIKVNNEYGFSGHPSLRELKIDNDYNIIQIEFSKTLRQNFRQRH